MRPHRVPLNAALIIYTFLTLIGGIFNIFDIGETNRDLSSALVTIHLISSYSRVIYKDTKATDLRKGPLICCKI